MLKKIIIAAVVLLTVGGGVFYYLVQPPKVADNCEKSEVASISIAYKDDQTFSPSCIIVKPGTKVTWVNAGSKELEVGADPHPVHTGNREVSGGAFELYVKPGTESTVTLTSPGIHGYHNHQYFLAKGVIRVE